MIRIPLSGVLKALSWVWNKITILWLKGTYEKSHEYKMKYTRIGSHWDKLGENIDYSLRLTNPADHDTLKSKIAFRSTQGLVQKLSLFFEVSGSGIRHQQKIELINLNKSPIIVSLDQIPKQDVIEISDKGMYLTIDEMCFRNCEVTREDGTISEVFDSKKYHLTYNWLLNDHWERRWGKIWNCNAIEHAKEQISDYWRWKLGEFHFFLLHDSFYGDLSIQSRIRKNLCKILINRHMLTLQFWLAIHSRLFSLGEGKLIYKNHKEN